MDLPFDPDIELIAHLEGNRWSLRGYKRAAARLVREWNMALTPKQVRNGIPGEGAAGGNVSQPGPTSDVSAVKGAAETYGGALASTGRQPFTGDTAGANGITVVDWDDSIAVTEGAGEA
jgi:hypothetical protein